MYSWEFLNEKEAAMLSLVRFRLENFGGNRFFWNKHERKTNTTIHNDAPARIEYSHLFREWMYTKRPEAHNIILVYVRLLIFVAQQEIVLKLSLLEREEASLIRRKLRISPSIRNGLQYWRDPLWSGHIYIMCIKRW